jgi:hypothetical protein
VAFFTKFLEGMDNRLMFDTDQMPSTWKRAVGYSSKR